MGFKDLREFLSLLESKGELVRIKKEVDWDEEIGAIAQEAVVKDAPAFVCENIKGHKDTPGKKLAMNFMSGWKRINLASGLPEDTSPREILFFWRKRTKHPIKPIRVDKGPCQQVVKKGNEVNLYDFPAPKLHPLDGGRYILTWHLDVSKDPETGWINCGTYRGMILDRNSIGRLIVQQQHMMIHARKYEKMGSALPTVAVIGTEPISLMVASSPIPAGIDEYAVWGGLRQEPVELVMAKTVDIPIPATAEIVLEGEISFDPSTFRPEGPFGEWPGRYSCLGSIPRPVFKVNCVTYREDPILVACNLGMGPDLVAADSDYVAAITFSAAIWDHLENYGIQGIYDVWCDPDALCANVFVAIDKLYYGHAKQVAAAIWGTSLSMEVGKFVVVVDKDVDIRNLKKINAAIAHRTQGIKDMIIYSGTFGGPLDPGVHRDVKLKTGGMGSWDRALIDATWPFEWEPREEWGGLSYPPSSLAREEMLKKIRTRWEEYGFR